MRRLLLLFIALAAPLILMADLGMLGPYLAGVHATPLGDKLLHVLVAGTFALLVNGALVSDWRSPRRALIVGTALTAAVLTVEEASNALAPVRSCSLGDLAANYLGTALAVALLAGWGAAQRGMASGGSRAPATGSPEA